MIKENKQLDRSLLAEKDRLVLELENMQEDLKRFALQQGESEDREAQMKMVIETLLKQRDEMRRTFLACQNSLELQLEQETGQCQEMERRHQIIQSGWIKHCEVLVQMILEKEKMLDSITDEVENLKETVDVLKQKACDTDLEKEVKEADKRLKSFAPRWFQKLQKKNRMTKKQVLEKEIETLELQLKDIKAREDRATEVINILVEERIKMKNQLGLGVIRAYKDSRNIRYRGNSSVKGMYGQMQLLLRESQTREASSTKVIETLVKEREEMKKRFWKQQEQVALDVMEERKAMEKEKDHERLELLEKEREAIEEDMVEKMTAQRRAFQAEKESLEKEIREKDKLLEMAGLMKEAGNKEGLKKAGWKIKLSPLRWFQKLWKKDKVKKKQEKEKRDERLIQILMTIQV